MSWYVQWSSSCNERYEGGMLTLAKDVVERSGIAYSEFGGSMIGVDPDEPGTADNGYDLNTDDELAVRRLAAELAVTLDRQVSVDHIDDEE